MTRHIESGSAQPCAGSDAVNFLFIHEQSGGIGSMHRKSIDKNKLRRTANKLEEKLYIINDCTVFSLEA